MENNQQSLSQEESAIIYNALKKSLKNLGEIFQTAINSFQVVADAINNLVEEATREANKA